MSEISIRPATVADLRQVQDIMSYYILNTVSTRRAVGMADIESV